jgi:molybdopterin molybdotransferase
MDGFAVTPGPAGRVLRLVGDSFAGRPSTAHVDETTAVRIATGAALPPNASAVVADESATLGDGTVELHIDAPAGLNVRLPGEDIPTGRTLVDPGTRLGPVELAVAIGAGHAQLVCHRRPRVAILATGNELCPPGGRLAAGQIYDSNTTALAGFSTQAGAAVVSRDRVGDDPADTRRACAAALGQADLLIVTGGVSVGPQDHVRSALAALGADERFAGVEVRPGRPAWFGTSAGRPVLALPGNPVAAIVIFLLLGRPALAALAGRPPSDASDRARLTQPARPNPGRTNVIGVRLGRSSDGALDAIPSGPLSAHATSPLLRFDALGILPPGEAPLDAGSSVEIVRISG